MKRIVPNPLSTFTQAEQWEYQYAKSGTAGLSTSLGTAGISCAANEVALVDKIEIACLTNDAATNVKVTCEVNGEELYFNFPGVANSRRTETLVWEPAGNLVVHPSGTMKWKASVASVASVTVTYRKMLLTKAAALGYLSPSLPTVASTNATAGSGTSADTAKALVTEVAGHYIEILGFTCTGHSFNAAVDSIAMGFMVTGETFSSAANKVFRAYASGASPFFAPKVVVHNTDGCIRGPVGKGLYVIATTNLAGSTPPADFNVLYRLVPAPVRTDNYKVATAITGTVTEVVVDKTIPTSTSQTGTLHLQGASGGISVDYTSYTSATFTIASTDFASNQVSVGRDCAVRFAYTPVNEPTGATGQAANRLSKWWAYTEASAPLYSGDAATPFFSTTFPACQVRIHGTAMSFVSDVPSLANAAALWGGATITGGAPFGNIIPLADDGNGAEVSRCYTSDNFIVCNSSQAPGFMTYEVVADEVLGRSQLAWGTFGSRATTGSDYISAF